MSRRIGPSEPGAMTRQELWVSTICSCPRKSISAFSTGSWKTQDYLMVDCWWKNKFFKIEDINKKSDTPVLSCRVNPKAKWTYFGLARGWGSSLPFPAGVASASSFVNNSNSASTFPYQSKIKTVTNNCWLYSQWAIFIGISSLTLITYNYVKMNTPFRRAIPCILYWDKYKFHTFQDSWDINRFSTSTL